MLISIEGIDGAGKNTLVQRIKKELSVEVNVLGFPVMKSRFMRSLRRMLSTGRWAI